MQIVRYSLACIIIIIFTILRQVHIIQLNSYNLDQQIIWYKKNIGSFVINIVLFVASIVYYELKFIPIYFVVIISIFGLLIENMPRKQKKKLVFTARIIRLIFLCSILFFILFIPAILHKNEVGIKFMLYALSLSPLIIFVAYLILLPIENNIRKKYMGEARKIIENNDRLYVVGITGSFGKTSVKFFLDRLLKIKYSVCKTPESFNTAMGTTLTIKNDLRNIDDIFISEMGARRIGDIKEICDIVSPFGAIITDVGNMHLDTFKNIENVLKTKFELVDSIYKNNEKKVKKIGMFDKEVEVGPIILLNGDNDLIRNKAKEYRSDNVKIYFYGLNTDNDFYANNIICDSKGTTFDFETKNGYDIEKINTKLLGKYNILNLVGAIAYALLLNVDKTEIKNEVHKISQVKHRLELLDSDPMNLIIDDAYNSNLNGAKNASDVLKTFLDYKKVIITPGMVELGDKQQLENEMFAEYAGKNVDYAIIVGNTNKMALKLGFNKSLDSDKVYCFEKIEDAISFARKEIEGKKVILLENDLSDNY